MSCWEYWLQRPALYHLVSGHGCSVRTLCSCWHLPDASNNPLSWRLLYFPDQIWQWGSRVLHAGKRECEPCLPSLTMATIFSKGHSLFVCGVCVCMYAYQGQRSMVSSFYCSLPFSSVTRCLVVSVFNNSFVWCSLQSCFRVKDIDQRGKCGKQKSDRSSGFKVSLLSLSAWSCERCFSFMCLRSLLCEMRS